MATGSLRPHRPVPRWWAPRDLRALAAGLPAGTEGQREHAFVAQPWLPGARLLARRRWLARQAQALASVCAQIDAARSRPHALPAWLAACRAQRQRAAARGDAQLDFETRHSALACAAAAMEPVLGQTLPAALLEAALALGDGAAVELHSARERQLALALAGAAAAFSGRPCHLLATDDEAAAASAAQLAPLWAACGLQAAAVGAATPPAESMRAYHADIVHASARRVAADLARDRRLRATAAWQAGHAHSPRPSLTRGLHTALLDDLDRVLIEDALSPLVLSIEDDATGLVAAIGAARHIADALQPGSDWLQRADGLLLLTDTGQARIAALADSLPGLWRTPERSALLVQQALFVRDVLRPDTDYQRGANGQPVFDERLAERLPEREWMTGLHQALQLRLGLPATPLSRTVERSSMQAFFAACHQLGGTAPCLDGLHGELWRGHGLLCMQPGAGPQAADAPLHCVTSAAALQDGVRAALAPGAAQAPGPATVLLLRRPTDAAAWAGLLQAAPVAMALEHTGPGPALRALGWPPPGAPGTPAQPAGPPLQLLLPEPLDSARAETAFHRRCADAAGTPAHQVRLVRLLHPQARVLRDGLGPGWGLAALAALAACLGRLWPAALPRLLAPCLALARWRLGRQHALQRRALLLRDQQLQQQLSFSGPARTAPPPSPAAIPAVPSHPAARTPPGAAATGPG